MVDAIATPASGAGLKLVQILTRIFPQIAGCEVVEIRLAVGEPIRLTLKCPARATEAVDVDSVAVDELSQSFYLREIDG